MRAPRTTRATGTLVLLAAMIVTGGAGYTVQPGDTLGDLADEFDTTVSALVAANQLRNPNLIRVGQVLVVPGAQATTHRVQRGETLARIAARYDVSMSALISANDITDPNRLRSGQLLQIPGMPVVDEASEQAEPVLYTVKWGDTLARIASEHGTTIEALAAANGISNPNLLPVGAQLVIEPDGTVGVTNVPEPVTADGQHVVQRGETLLEIAAQYNTTVTAIVDRNGIRNPNLIRIGQILVVPVAWVCPVPGSSFVNDFGYVKPSGRIHAGIDMFAPRGAPVLAPVSGTVTQKIGSVGGKQIELVGDDGFWYLGSHLDAFAKSGHVHAGDVIGTVGDSGNALGAPTHLHFEMHPIDEPAINPYETLVTFCP